MTTENRLLSHRFARTLTLALLGLAVGSSAGLAQSKTTLRWKFKEGETLHYNVQQKTVTTGQDPSGREMKGTLELTTDMSWTVKSVDGSGVASWNQTIDRVRVSVTSPGSKMSSDSKEAGDLEGPFAPIFKILVGAEFQSKMNPRGELVEIKLADKLLATLAATNEGGGPKGAFSEDGLKNMLTQMIVPLPEAAVALGETWERKLTVPGETEGQGRLIEQVFTDQGPEPGSPGWEAIDFVTKMEPRKPDPRFPITYKKETTSGRFDFDNTLGRIVKSNSTEVVEVSLTMQGKESPRKVETTRVMILSKDNAP